LSHTTDDNTNFYETWDYNGFKDFINDNPDDEDEIRNEYNACLLLTLEEN
jgi:hypothetical protein